MKPSIMQTMSVPGIGTASPAMVIQAGDEAMRVMVRNIGGTIVLLAHETNSLTQVGATAGVYQLPAGAVDIFVLAPKQTLVAAANGAAGQLSVAASEAIPIGKHWMES